MKIALGKSALEIIQGDIASQDTQAVVNAANQQLAPGGGVAGVIHKAAGPGLWKECRKLGGCATGQARLTKGYGLPNEYVIHTVGPVYSGKARDAELLSSCYRESIKLAAENNITSISFPALSTGVFGYPLDEAASVALCAIVTALEKYSQVELVRMVLYDEAALTAHLKAVKKLGLT